MAPPPMSQIFSAHDMHSTYQYPNLNQVRQIKPSTAPHLTPYLGSRSRLSQVWFNRWTLLLALIIVRVFLSTQSLDDDINSAKREALAACTSVERAGSAMASMPHYMAQGVNELTTTAIEASVRALHQTLILAISAVREILIFVIHMMVGTYVCLITFAITGTAGALIDATKEIGESVNNTIADVVGGIEKEIGGFQDALSGAIEEATAKLNELFGGEIDIPELKLPSLDKLKQFQIPTGFDDKLNELKDKLPNFREVREAGESVIRIPFDLLQGKIKNTLGVYKFDRSVFPVPPKEKLAFCSENNDISDFFGNLKQIVNKTKTIVIAVLITIAILAIVPMAWLEIRRWRIMRQRAYMFGANSNYDPVDITYLASRPSSGTWGLRFASGFHAERRQVLVRWAVAYVTSPPALFVLSLGVAGLISALAQYIVLKQVEKAVPELAEQVGGFAGEVVELLNNASAKFADNTNSVLTQTTDNLNEEVFGWLTNGTQNLNDTLNTFSRTMQIGIDQYLGGTPLKTAAEGIIDCLIGLKIESLQKGLTWLHDNAKISFPSIAQDTFSLGALNSLDSGNGGDSFLADPEGASSDMITETLFKLSQRWHDTITTEASISGGVVLVWVLVLVIALVRTGTLWWGKNNVRGDGGGRGTNFISGPAFVTPPPQSQAAREVDAYDIHPPVPAYSANTETIHLGSVNSRRDVPEPIPGEWVDEKRRGSISSVSNA